MKTGQIVRTYFKAVTIFAILLSYFIHFTFKHEILSDIYMTKSNAQTMFQKFMNTEWL
jgi:hypothetical protein